VKAAVKDTGKPFVMLIQITAKEGAGEKIDAAFARASAPTHREKGCLAYEMSHDPQSPTHYVLYEHWQNLEALEAHLRTPYTSAVLRELRDLTAGPPEVRILVPVGN
jgi:quinol monooxygenase YgiN